jgi:hypothetical protein
MNPHPAGPEDLARFLRIPYSRRFEALFEFAGY